MIVFTKSHEGARSHAGPHRNNRLIKARRLAQGSSQVFGSWLDDGMSGKGGGGGCFFF